MRHHFGPRDLGDINVTACCDDEGYACDIHCPENVPSWLVRAIEDAIADNLMELIDAKEGNEDDDKTHRIMEGDRR